jgi:CheY-like chemotaxis protein
MRDALQVLVVEDDPRSRDALTLALEQLGHSVTATGDLQDALRLFLDGDFTVVFTDLSLGEKSGWEVAQAVKKMRSAVEVILVTGWAAQLGVDDPSTRGVDQVLAKPFTLEQIGAVLDRARQRRLAAQRTATA